MIYENYESVLNQESALNKARFNQCPCCASARSSVVWDNPVLKSFQNWKDFMYGGRQFIEKIIQCDDCGFRYIQTPKIRDDFYAQADNSSYSSLKNARLRYFLELKTALQMRGLILPDEANILDVGAGEGDWLTMWPEVRHKYATEMQPILIRRMKERGIITMPTLDNLKDTRCHLISAFDFLEHVEDPNQLLQLIHDRLVAGGTIVIGVPDMGKWVARLFGTRYYLYCPMHYSYFTAKSLHLLLSKYFSHIDIFPSPPMRTTLNGMIKWVFPKLQRATLDKIWLPLGYRASLIAIARKAL